ncbi:unnamed protein product [Prorocentrum cordatum]|uniref:Uncharacterized protein n=1 Tax=Prorocentrum cordatum TaxID=2364126 RepID=A0ABN9SN78_9DINO|nr:unnamed protein product [Polarella glacialis]
MPDALGTSGNLFICGIVAIPKENPPAVAVLQRPLSKGNGSAAASPVTSPVLLGEGAKEDQASRCDCLEEELTKAMDAAERMGGLDESALESDEAIEEARRAMAEDDEDEDYDDTSDIFSKVSGEGPLASLEKKRLQQAVGSGLLKPDRAQAKADEWIADDENEVRSIHHPGDIMIEATLNMKEVMGTNDDNDDNDDANGGDNTGIQQEQHGHPHTDGPCAHVDLRDDYLKAAVEDLAPTWRDPVVMTLDALRRRKVAAEPGEGNIPVGYGGILSFVEVNHEGGPMIKIVSWANVSEMRGW